jgi:hypothetical protein
VCVCVCVTAHVFDISIRLGETYPHSCTALIIIIIILFFIKKTSQVH